MSWKRILSEYLMSLSKPVKEYELLSYLQNTHSEFFDELGVDASLYKRHFLLFHYLYQLDHDLSAEGLSLEISVLSIQIVPLSRLGNSIRETDSLRCFYSDKENLKLSDQEIIEMQHKFWEKYLAIDKKSRALLLLGLETEVDINLQRVKQRYRELAQHYHPDKGGDAAQFRELQQAYRDLKVLFC